MGGAYSKEQDGPGNGIVVDTPMAAAASTLLYQLQYGGDDVPNRLEASNGKKALHHLGSWICVHLLTKTWTTSLMDSSFLMRKIFSSTSTMIRRKSDYDHHSQRATCKRIAYPVALNPPISPCTPNLNNKRCWMHTSL